MFVKICGITTPEDAAQVCAAGADAVGLVFAPSPRRVDVESARRIVGAVTGSVRVIGVFRDAPVTTVIDTVESVGLTGVQLHGNESPADMAAVRGVVPFLIRAIPIDALLGDGDGDSDGDRGGDGAASASSWEVDVILVDSPQPGSGRAFDWETLDPLGVPRPLMLAGGLTPENVGDAVRRVRPWGVDVSSGVESSPGRKDGEAIRRFVIGARDAFSEFSPDGRPA